MKIHENLLKLIINEGILKKYILLQPKTFL